MGAVGNMENKKMSVVNITRAPILFPCTSLTIGRTREKRPYSWLRRNKVKQEENNLKKKDSKREGKKRKKKASSLV